MVFGRNTTNTGEILGGDGGNVLGSLEGYGGNGGETHVWGKWNGAGFLVNRGLARGGNGGSGSEAAVGKQRGGSGGRLKLISLPLVDLQGGKQYGGVPGLGSGGGSDGTAGAVVIEPVVISLAGPGTEVKGGDIIIFGGDSMTLDLSSMGAAALSASGSITLAVGAGSTIDLRGSTQPVLHAADRVFIASDSILLADGIQVKDLVDAGSIAQGPAEILADLSLLMRGATVGERAVPISITLTLLNGAPIADTVQLIPVVASGWQLDGLPPSVTLQGHGGPGPGVALDAARLGSTRANGPLGRHCHLAERYGCRRHAGYRSSYPGGHLSADGQEVTASHVTPAQYGAGGRAAWPSADG